MSSAARSPGRLKAALFVKPAADLFGELRYYRVATKKQGWRGVGGLLFVAGATLGFEPTSIDRALRGRSWSVPIVSITEFDIAPRGADYLAGGLRRRLLVLTNDEEAIFLVNHLQDVIQELTHIRDASGLDD